MYATLFLTVPVVPKKNSAIISRGRYIKNPRARASEDGIRIEASMEFRKAGWKTPVADRISMVLLFPHHPRADAIGLAETILDALQGVAYLNDRQVKVLTISMQAKGEGAMAKDGRSCQIEISTI